LEATSRIVKRNEDKVTEEAAEPSSARLTEEREGDNANGSATSEHSIEPAQHPNPLQRVTRSMRRIQKALGVPRVDRIQKTLGVQRVDTPTQAAEETQPSPRVDGSSTTTSKLAAPGKVSKPKPHLSAKKERASKSKAR